LDWRNETRWFLQGSLQLMWPVAQATDTSLEEGDAGSIPALKNISDRLVRQDTLLKTP